MVWVDNSEADNLVPKAPEYGDANSILNGGPQNAAPPAPPPITPSYVDTSYQQPQPSYSPPAPSQSAYGLNYGPQNNGDANNDGLNDQTGWANGVVQDYSSPSGFSYNGIPVTSDGAQYNPGPQQPQSEAGYNLNFASPFGGTANDAPVAPYMGPTITGYPSDPNAINYGTDADVARYNRDYGGGGGGGFLDTLGNIAGNVGDALSINPFNAPARPEADPNQSFLGALGHANNVALQDWQTPLVPSETIQNIPGFDRIPGGNYLADFISGSTSPIGAFSIPAGNAAGELIGAGTAGILGDTALTRILGAGATGAALNTGLTGFNQATTGTFDPQELAKQAAIGFGLGAAIPAAGEAFKGVRGLHDAAINLDQRINEPVPGGAMGQTVTKGMAKADLPKVELTSSTNDLLVRSGAPRESAIELAQTIAKVQGDNVVGAGHIAEALQYLQNRDGSWFTDPVQGLRQSRQVYNEVIRNPPDYFSQGDIARTKDAVTRTRKIEAAWKRDNRGDGPVPATPTQGTEVATLSPEPATRMAEPVQKVQEQAPPPGPPARPVESSSPGPLPKPAELGDSGIRAAIATKETTTREAGPLGRAADRVPGLNRVRGIAQPSINLERPIHVANQAEAAVKAELSTKFAATRKPILDEIKASGLDGGANAPEYIGPAKNPIKNTFIDRVENPQDYRLTQPQKNLIQRIATRDAENVNLARGQYNADVGLYAPKNEGAAYVPHINANEDIIQRSAKAEAALTNPRIAKERVYDTARERAIASDKFKPETDPARLLEAHDNAIANMAGKETFKAGAGGLNKAEAIAQVNPGLAKRYDALKTKLQSMKGTASRLDERTSNAIDTFLKSGQTEEDMAALRESLRPVVGKNAVGKEGPNFGKDKAALNRDIAQVKQQIDAIRPAWKNYNLQEKGFEMSPYTYKYHSPEEAASIASIKQTSNGPLDKVLAAGEVSRATVLGGDLSPITIQGQLNLGRDPVSTAIGFAKMIRQGGIGLEDVARSEPDLVARYTRATGHALGNVSPEFSPRQSILARLPKVGPVFAAMDEKMFGAMQRIQYESWKRNVDFVGKIMKNTPQDVVDHEVANALSKTVPGLSGVERGLSPARAQLERAGLTSPSFLAAPALVVKDASSGLVKALALHPRNITGRELVAMKQLITMAGMVEAVSLTSAALNAESRGLSPEEAIKKALTPGDRTFLAIQAGGYTAPLGGPFRSAITGLAPKYRNGEWQAPDLLQFAKSKLAPFPGTAVDLLQNSDYFGNKIRQGDPLEQLGRVAEYIGENIGLPLTAGAVAEGIRTGRSLGETLQNAGSQALGSNVNNASPYEDRDVQARKAYGKNWNDLSPVEQNALKAQQGSPAATYESTNPDAVASAKAIETIKGDAAKEQGGIDTKYAAPGSTTPKTPQDGIDWRDEYRMNQYGTLREYRLKDQLMPYNGPQSTNEMRQAVDQYFATIEANKSGTKVNWDAVDSWLAAHPDIKAQVDAYQNDPNKPNTDYSPMVTQYKAASKALGDAGYFDVKDNVWKELAKNDPELSKFPTYYDWKASIKDQVRSSIDPSAPQSVVDGIVEKVVNKIPVTTIYSKVSNTAEKAWLADHPKLAALAYQWGYLGANPSKLERAIAASGAGQ